MKSWLLQIAIIFFFLLPSVAGAIVGVGNPPDGYQRMPILVYALGVFCALAIIVLLLFLYKFSKRIG